MIVESIYNWADRTPDAVAVIQDEREITYRSLARRISRLRAFLHEKGCVEGGEAAVITPVQSDFWVGSLALRSLGYTTRHIPSLQLLQEMPASRQTLVVFGGQSLPARLARVCVEKGFRTLPIQFGGEGELELNRGPPIARMGGHLLRTSGTTGGTKLVLMTAEMDSIFLRRKTEVAGIDQATVLGAFNFPPWTAAGYRWTASPWCVGGTTILSRDDAPTSVLRHPKLTHAFMVPMNLQRALDLPVEAFARNARLRLMVAGGAMTARQVERVHDRITSSLFNLIASTEAGLITCTPIHSPADMLHHDLLEDRGVEIVDEADRPLDRGAVGRIRVLQTGLPDRYHDNDAASRQSFRDGYFYSGDLGAIDVDGRLSLHGRTSDIVNIGGYKVSPIDVEHRLHDELGSPACILADRSRAGAEEIHVVFEAGRLPPQESVMALLTPWRQHVSSIRIHHVAAFPRTETGKIMRDRLRVMIAGATAGDPDA